MSGAWLGCIVDGQGEEAALPLLVRRIAGTVDPGLVVEVRCYRIKRGRIGPGLNDLETAILRLRKLLSPPGGILALFDSDDDDPVALQAALVSRLGAALAGDGTAYSAVLASREYEAWFLTAADPLRGLRGLADDLAPPPNPEAVRGAKQWLSRHMAGGRRYRETADQAAFTAQFDMDVARKRSPSFASCYSEIERLLRQLLAASAGAP